MPKFEFGRFSRKLLNEVELVIYRLRGEEEGVDYYSSECMRENANVRGIVKTNKYTKRAI